MTFISYQAEKSLLHHHKMADEAFKTPDKD
jgi:hypothetical protein